MKKNKMMRIASVLLIAVLMTTCAISGTFAKYVTSAEGGDSARVAKWGVNITVSGETFAEAYDTSANVQTVISNASDDVVAPGTGGSLAALAVTGTPEVQVTVTYEAELTLTGWNYDGAFYCPIIISVEGEDINGLDYDSADEFAEAVTNAIAEYSETYAANTDLSAVNDDLTVTWSWPYETVDESGNSNDAKDTLLGNAAAAGNAAEIELNVTCTITQDD